MSNLRSARRLGMSRNQHRVQVCVVVRPCICTLQSTFSAALGGQVYPTPTVPLGFSVPA